MGYNATQLFPRVHAETGKLEKVCKTENFLKSMEKVWEIEQMSGKRQDFLCLTSGGKEVHKTAIDFTKAVLQRYIRPKFKVQS